MGGGKDSVMSSMRVQSEVQEDRDKWEKKELLQALRTVSALQAELKEANSL